jgi:hypothetical protein
MKIAFFLLLLALSLSCHKSGGESSPGDDFDLSLSGVTDSDFVTVPVQASTFNTNLDLVNFVSTEEAKMAKAIEIVKLVVATEDFKNKILNHTYNGEKTFVENGGYSNAQIYQKILDGAEKLFPIKNNTMDAELELYYDSTNVVGYTYASGPRIFINTKYFNVYTPAGVAHNLFHEWMHKLGFVHAASWSASRDYSVPYAVGVIVGEIGNDFL